MVSQLKQNSGAQSATIGEGGLPKLKTIRKDPIAQAVVSKLVHTQGHQPNRMKGQGAQPPAPGYAQKVSDHTRQNITDNINIFQLLPDTELAMQILVSSILSPKDMTNVELGYKVDPRSELGEIAGPMLEAVRSYFDETYKIKTILPEILEEVLFKKGSYPVLVLPENSVDQVINADTRVSLESLRGDVVNEKGEPLKSIGLLGAPGQQPNQSWSLENLISGGNFSLSNEQCEITIPTRGQKTKSLNLSVTDNLDIVKFPKVLKRMRQERIQDVLGSRGLGLEANRTRRATKKDQVGELEIEKAFYRRAQSQKAPYLSLKTQGQLDRKAVGHPLVMRLPPEAVIPVHVPSNPEDHIGYFILLDTQGNPLNRVKEADYYRDLATNISSDDITSQLLESGRRASEGYGRSDQAIDESERVRLYAEVVEQDLLSRLKNGVYGDGVEIGRPLDVYRVMFARSLANLGTQILYVPSELITYFAFDYNENGVGKSLLEDNKILASIRAMLLFSNTMAAIKNSTGKTGLKIELDPDDPDPSSTVEYMIHEYSRNRQAAYPLGASNPLDIVDFLQNAGIDIQVSGNAAYPETRLDVEDYSSSKVEIDSQLEEDIRDRYFMGLGLSPETIDQTKDVEFATSVVTSNLLLAKRVILYQDKLVYFIKDFMLKYIQNSSYLMGALEESLEGNKGQIPSDYRGEPTEKLINAFLETMEVHLPRPDTAKLENQIESFRTYTDAVEQAVDAYFGEDAFMLREFDDVEEDIRAVRAATIAYYQRQWMRNNNVLPEMMALIDVGEDGKPELDLNDMHGAHLEHLGKSVSKLFKKLRRAREKREREAEELENQLEEEAKKREEEREAEAQADQAGTDDEGGAETGTEPEGEEGADETEGSELDEQSDVGETETEEPVESETDLGGDDEIAETDEGGDEEAETSETEGGETDDLEETGEVETTADDETGSEEPEDAGEPTESEAETDTEVDTDEEEVETTDDDVEETDVDEDEEVVEDEETEEEDDEDEDDEDDEEDDEETPSQT